MRIAVTLEQCWHRVPGGTAVAALAVSGRLAGRPGVEQVGVAAWHGGPPPEPWRPRIPVRALPLPRRAMYAAWLWPRVPPVQLVTRKVDLIHATTIIVPPRTAALIVTIHDLAFLHEPGHFTAHGERTFRRGLELVRRHAALVFASSEATMEDCAAAGIPGERLRHVPLGVDVVVASRSDVDDVRRRYGLERPYLLSVGTLEPRKNLARVVAAVDRLGDDRVLAVVGPNGWGDAVPASSRRARLLGFVPERDLRALYAGADAFVYPSLREGFGLPVAEAMAQGAPVVTSAGTSTEEVAGGAAILVDPTDTDAIAAGIETAVADRDRLGAAGRRRAEELSWDVTADATLAGYRELA